MTIDPRTRRADCERIAREAGALLRSRFGDPGEVLGKGETADEIARMGDLVTEVDGLAEALILGRIAELSADAVVLAEEGGLTTPDGSRTDADPATAAEVWLIDPLDGTVNFAHGVPHFCTSIACWSNGEPVAGAVVDPMVGELFSFERHPDGSATAFHDGVEVELPDVRESHQTMLYVGGGGASLIPLIRAFRSWRRMGSATLALCWVGVGRCGAYVQPGLLNPWDWGVGAPFVQAVGGIVTDSGGLDWAAKLSGTTGMVAAPPRIHAAIADLAAAASASG
ncbi:MAG: inositol monophosphatase [Thermoleophilia bacterium]|nr:inositol monophosphatase [Thermoleophilia bacterium]MCZ4495904.1 inositol monophosphatase [Thermoleophilia bacterium]